MLQIKHGLSTAVFNISPDCINAPAQIMHNIKQIGESAEFPAMKRGHRRSMEKEFCCVEKNIFKRGLTMGETYDMMQPSGGETYGG